MDGRNHAGFGIIASHSQHCPDPDSAKIVDLNGAHVVVRESVSVRETAENAVVVGVVDDKPVACAEKESAIIGFADGINSHFLECVLVDFAEFASFRIEARQSAEMSEPETSLLSCQRGADPIAVEIFRTRLFGMVLG